MSKSLSFREGLEQRVRRTVERAIANERLVGAVIRIALDGDVVAGGAFGLADREARRPMQEDAIFRFSSLTKPIVTAAALAAIERGRIGLDDAVTRWLPEFRPRTSDGAEATIRVRHLLTHTAGLNYGFFPPADNAYNRAGVGDGLRDVGLSMTEQLRRLSSVPLSFQPGTAWQYSLGMDVLGEVLARASGKPLPDVVSELVTGPLNLDDTGFVARDPARLATVYADDTPPRCMRDGETVPAPDGSTFVYSPSRIFDGGSFHSGGAGMAGTAGDFLKFLETIRLGGGPILKSESVRAMLGNQIGPLRINVEPTPAWGFGLGGAVLMDPELAQTPQALGTWKWGGVYGHHWYVDPANRLTVVALTNTTLEGFCGPFVEDLRNAVYGTGAAIVANG